MEELEGQRLNLDKPRWEQNTYFGRVRHFFATTNPINVLRTSKDLEQAKDIVTRYRAGEKVDLPDDEIWRAKHIYDSAFHPDTGEKMVIIGRMAAQVPMCSLIGGCMLTFYKTPKEVIFWQWFNQSFNAIVNYTNRSGSSPISPTQLGFSYVCATSGAVAAALSLNSLVKKAPPLIGRFVPLAAIAVANCINIPMMRMQELTDGIPVVDNNGNELGNSKVAAQSGIAAVTVSRVALGSGTLVFAPIAMNYLEKRGVLRRFRWASLPIQMMMIGLSYTFATPMCCALFPQQASIKVSNLEGKLQERIMKQPSHITEVYYNKGL